MPLPADYLQGEFTPRPGKSWPACARSVETRLAYRKWGTSPGGAVAPLAASATAFMNAVAGPNTTTAGYTRVGPSPIKTATGGAISGTLFGGATSKGNMDCPRNVVITVTGAVAVSGVIYGLDEFNRLISEAWTLAGAGAFTGKKAFAQVDAVTVTAVADASAIAISAGTGNVLGLPARSAVGGVAAALKETTDGAPVVTGTLVAASTAATDDLQGTYLPATVPNGAHIYEVWFLVNDDQL